MSARDPDREQGFILIAATWLLLLLGALAAVFVLRSIHASREAHAAEDQLRQRLVLESAAETVIASHLFDGPYGPWAAWPASGTVAIGNTDVAMKLSSETGRLDLNTTSPEVITRALQGMDVDADTRRAFMDGLGVQRAMGRMAHFSDLQRLAAELDAPISACIEDAFTLYSGLKEPRTASLPTPLARALDVRDRNASTPPIQGDAVRVRATLSSGQSRIVVVRRQFDEISPYAMMAVFRC